MPGLEKRLARYPQLYSRVGFVHQFRPLADRGSPGSCSGNGVPLVPICPRKESPTSKRSCVLRITGGNFRLLARLLTQIARILEVNEADEVTVGVVEAARESLVIGAA